MTEGGGGKLENIGGNTAEGRPFTKDDIKRLPVEVFDRILEKTMGPKVEESDNDDVIVKKNNQEDKGSIGIKIAAGLAAGILGATGVGIAAPPHASAEENRVGINPNNAVYEKGKMTSQNATGEYLAGLGLKAEILTPGSIESVVEKDPTIVALESIGWSTEGYINRLEKIAVNKEKLLTFGENEDRLDACAEIMYSIETCDGFKDPRVYNRWQESILGNFISVEEVELFYETGDLDLVDEYCKKELERNRNWDPIYFKDEKGKDTSKLAMIYVYNPEIKHFDVDDIEYCIDWWVKKGAKDFLETLVNNNARVVLQSQASSNEKIGGFKYGYNIIYCNYSRDNLSGFKSSFISALGEEQNGVRGEALEGEQKSDIVALLKARVARDCCEYLLVKTGDDKFAILVEGYQLEVDDYTQDKWISKGKSVEELEAEYAKVKSVGLITPFVATWPEIDAALVGN
jgi:hypothetical protein